MSFSTLIKFISPPDADAPPQALTRWRWIMSGYALLTSLLLMWILGMLEVTGLPRHAFADEIDQKIRTALQPINEKLASMEDKDKVSEAYLKRLVKRDIREDIYAKLVDFCKETDAIKRRMIRAEIDNLQDEYKAAAGEEYTEPRCADL